jgi:hypothetical protein
LRFVLLIVVQAALVAASGVLALRARPSPEVTVLGYEDLRSEEAPGGDAPASPFRPVVLPAPPPPASPPAPLDEAALDAAVASASAGADETAALLARARLSAADRLCGLRPDQAPALARILLRHASRDLADRAALSSHMRKAAAECRGWYRAAGTGRAEATGDLTPLLRRIDPELDRLLAAREAFEVEAREEIRGILTAGQAAVLDRAGAFALLRR